MLLSLWGRESVVQPAWGPEPGPFSQALHWLALCLPSHFVGSRTIFPPLGPASSSTSSAYSGKGAAMGVLHPGPGGRRVGWPGPQEGACLEFLEVAGAWNKAWTSSASTKGFVCHDLGEISETAVHDSFDTPTRPIGWKGSCKTGQMAE